MVVEIGNVTVNVSDSVAADTPNKQEAPVETGISPIDAIPLKMELVSKWAATAQNVVREPGSVWEEAIERFRIENAAAIAAVEAASGQQFSIRRPGQPGFPALLTPKGSPEPAPGNRTAIYLSERSALQKEAKQVVASAKENNQNPDDALRRWEAANEPRLLENRRKAVELHEFPWDHNSAQPRPGSG